ncbi:protein of unknown function [Burkholderia multivorans]
MGRRLTGRNEGVANDDRRLQLGDPERPQGAHHARGDGARLSRASDRHWRGRPVLARIPEDQPEQQNSGDRRSGRPGRPAARAVRIGRDPRLSRGKDWPVPAGRPGRALHDAGMADVPDGRHRADARAGPPFPPVRAGKDRLCDQPLHERSPAPVQRDGQAARRNRLPGRRRLHDRGHRGVPVDPLVAEPGHRARRVAERQALARGDRRAAGRATRRRGAGVAAPAAAGRPRARSAVRRDAVREALIAWRMTSRAAGRHAGHLRRAAPGGFRSNAA